MHPSDSGFMPNYSEVPSDVEQWELSMELRELSMELRAEVHRWGSQEDLGQLRREGVTCSPGLWPSPQLSMRSRIRVCPRALNLLSSGCSRQISPAGTQVLQMAQADEKSYFLFICLVYTKRNFTFFQDILPFNTLLCPRAYPKSLWPFPGDLFKVA